MEAITAEAIDKLSGRIAFFDEQDTPYLSRIKPYRANVVGDYDHLARVREWSLSGWTEAEE
jgi:ATP-dependent helicase/nuclease subunit B